MNNHCPFRTPEPEAIPRGVGGRPSHHFGLRVIRPGASCHRSWAVPRIMAAT